MPDVAAFAIVRRGDPKASILARQRAAMIECAGIDWQHDDYDSLDAEPFTSRNRVTSQ